MIIVVQAGIIKQFSSSFVFQEIIPPGKEV